MNKEIIWVKKDIYIDGVRVLKGGMYDKDEFVKRYKFFDLADAEYFETRISETIPLRTKVLYNGEKYYVVSIIRPKDEYNKLNIIADYNFKLGGVDPIYYIAKSTTARQKDWKAVHSSEIKIMSQYYFINSSGEIAIAYYGEKPNADKWRGVTSNIFDTMDAAREFRNKTLSIFKYK